MSKEIFSHTPGDDPEIIKWENPEADPSKAVPKAKRVENDNTFKKGDAGKGHRKLLGVENHGEGYDWDRKFKRDTTREDFYRTKKIKEDKELKKGDKAA